MPRVRAGYAVGTAFAVAGLALGASAAAGGETAPAETAPAATAPAATAPPAATATPNAGATTTAPAAPAPATTAPAATASTPAAATLAAAPAPASGCPPVGAVAVLRPHQRPLVLAPARRLAGAEVAYPGDGSILTAEGFSLATSCTASRPAGGTAQIRGLSLFDGAVTARAATLSLTGGASSVSGLRVHGRPAALARGRPIRLGDWGYLLAPDPSSPSRSALEVELSRPQAGLPAGTILFVPYAHIELAPAAPPPETQEETTTPAAPEAAPGPGAAGAAAPPRAGPGEPPPGETAPGRGRFPSHDENPAARPSGEATPARPERQPLTVTPALLGGPYVFPVSAVTGFGDTYGGPRSDVPGSWHHGDDIFAPLGTPVLAVADGRLNRVGWERLGGWRLWLRDDAGDQFYYAHLSGYSPLALLRGRVRRGDVIGFVGNTGDAFTTLPHLHFEVHPRELLFLRYDGAVDPTSYLESWPRPERVTVPRPVLPRLPHLAQRRREALENFRELLAARGLARHARHEPPARRLKPEPRPPVAAAAAAAPAPHRGSTAFAAWLAAGSALAAAAAAAWLLVSRRRRAPPA